MESRISRGVTRLIGNTAAVAAFFLGTALSIAQAQPSAESEGRQRAGRMEAVSPVGLDYLLYLPPDYEEKKQWPLLLFLHGSGERGSDLEKVVRHGPPRLIAEGKDFPFIVVSPQCPEDRWWEPHVLSALLDDLATRYKVDGDRVYCTGLSMGGFGTWAMGFYAPERFAALAPICGGGETYWVERFAHVPVWAFHGRLDTEVPPERSEKMIAAIKEAGGSPRLTIYPEAGHNSWTETYVDPKFYEWLLGQRRVGPANSK